jgi:hypothetical protein
VKNCTFNGVSGKRNAQLYAPKAELLDNTFKAGHASYGIRVGNGGKDSGDNYIGGEIKLDGNTFKEAGSADASAIQFYMLANTRVELGENTQDGSFKYLCAANNEWIFTNGNTFDPEYMYNSGTLELIPKKDEPVQGSLLTRVWGKYTASSNWDDSITDRNEWDRNAVMTADKIYVAVAGANAGQYGVAVFNRESGRYLETITSGIETGGCTFNTCGIARMEDGSIFVCNLARDGQTLKIYRLDTEAKTLSKIITYDVPSGARFGDVMTALGTSTDGLLSFVNYYNANSETVPGYIEFRVSNGVWETTPVRSQLFQKKKDANQMGGMYMFASSVIGSRTALFASNNEVNYRMAWTYSTNPMDGWYISAQDGEGNTLPGSAFSDEGTFEKNMMDPRWFWWTDDNKYLVYVSVESVDGKPAGYLRIVRMTGSTWFDQFKNTATETVSEKYPIGSADDLKATGALATSLTGYCDIYNDGEGGLYILAGITETGMSLFKMN